MRPILYDEFETAFDSNGIGVLSDTIDIHVDSELNGIYELEMKYPASGIHFEDIVHRAIIVTSVDPVSEPQPFRIYRIVPTSKWAVTIYARHIAYDLMGIVVSPFSTAAIDTALMGLKTNAVTPCPFEFWTDKTTVAAMTCAVPKSIWNLLGGSQGSILDVYGGEYEFDRWNIKLHSRRGADRGASILYGKNLISLEQDSNIANCYTGVYPYWTNQDGLLVDLPEKVIYAEGEFTHTKIYPLDLSTEWPEPPTEDQLRSRTEKYIKDNDITTPTVSIKVEFVRLEQTEEYMNIAPLERVLLGDTVRVHFPKPRIDATARVVKFRWKPLQNRYQSVTIGSVKANIADTIVKQQQEIEKKPSMTLVQQVMTKLADALSGALGGAVRLLDTNGDGMPDELYIANNPDPAQATIVWRFNYMGWAVSRTGYNGPFEMGATLDDGILANFITAANLIAGTIRSADGSFYLNLDTGEITISGVATPEDIEDLRVNGVEKVVTPIMKYSLTDGGLKIKKPGEEIDNTVDNTGMYVYRGTDIIFRGNKDGVLARDVQVKNFLIVGEHCRYEDYDDGEDGERTGCFGI